jgi:glycosyltransferase involved in cell wall biosynthesis
VPDGRTRPDFVLLYAPPWSGPTRFSKHHLAQHLADTGGRVLYVEAPLSPLGLRRGRPFLQELKTALQPPRPVADRLWVRRHFLPVPYHAASWLTSRRAANRLGQRLLAPAIARDLGRLGFDNPVLIAGLPHAVDALPWLPKRQALVYHCADDYAHVQGFPDTLPELEADLCQQADLVITTSETLCEERRRFNPNTHWVPNGADIGHFSAQASPAPELQHIRRPIVGFVGGLSQWVDIRLIAALALARKDWSFVLVGPVGTDVSALNDLGNVTLLGARPYTNLPAYLAAMDVGLIPFKQDRVTYHADPIKAYEYLAAGLPVVATEMPALRRLSHVVRLASSPQSFEAQIAAAVAEGRAAKKSERQAEAARHSWTSRFETIDALFRESVMCAS